MTETKPKEEHLKCFHHIITRKTNIGYNQYSFGCNDLNSCSMLNAHFRQMFRFMFSIIFTPCARFTQAIAASEIMHSLERLSLQNTDQQVQKIRCNDGGGRRSVLQHITNQYGLHLIYLNPIFKLRCSAIVIFIRS